MSIIRLATVKDASAISALIHDLKHYFIQELKEPFFLSTITPDAIKGYIEGHDFMYWVFLIEDQIVGVISVRNLTHLYHLFVAESHQGQKISRLLWEHMKTVLLEKYTPKSITVNSSLYAVKIYERFGFKCTGELTERSGIRFVPMQYLF